MALPPNSGPRDRTTTRCLFCCPRSTGARTGSVSFAVVLYITLLFASSHEALHTRTRVPAPLPPAVVPPSSLATPPAVLGAARPSLLGFCVREHAEGARVRLLLRDGLEAAIIEGQAGKAPIRLPGPRRVLCWAAGALLLESVRIRPPFTRTWGEGSSPVTKALGWAPFLPRPPSECPPPRCGFAHPRPRPVSRDTRSRHHLGQPCRPPAVTSPQPSSRSSREALRGHSRQAWLDIPSAATPSSGPDSAFSPSSTPPARESGSRQRPRRPALVVSDPTPP